MKLVNKLPEPAYLSPAPGFFLKFNATNLISGIFVFNSDPTSSLLSELLKYCITKSITSTNLNRNCRSKACTHLTHSVVRARSASTFFVSHLSLNFFHVQENSTLTCIDHRAHVTQL